MTTDLPDRPAGKRPRPPGLRSGDAEGLAAHPVPATRLHLCADLVVGEPELPQLRHRDHAVLVTELLLHQGAASDATLPTVDRLLSGGHRLRDMTFLRAGGWLLRSRGALPIL